jgi:hypothetical protein
VDELDAAGFFPKGTTSLENENKIFLLSANEQLDVLLHFDLISTFLFPP